MYRTSKHKQKKTKAIFVALFLVVIFFSIGTIFSRNNDAGIFTLAHSAHAITCTGNTHPNGTGTACDANAPQTSAQIAAAGTHISVPSIGGIFTTAINMLIYAVFVFFSWLLTAATSLFAWILNPANMSVLNNVAITQVWTNVRDFLNMFFIMVLLFSAFCTIFQYDKWGLKTVWLRIVINALLVNFSFTIARFIIDVSNVTMYYMLNNIFPSVSASGAGSILTKIGGDSGIQKMLVPNSVGTYQTSYLIAATVFIFILAITFLVIACLFVIRLAVLAILIMFSPVGFVGYIFPPLHTYADMWWKKLFQYSFFAPIMVFMIAISIKIMEAMGSNNLSSFIQTASSQTTSSSEAGFIASLAFFVIPIIILWIGMGISQQMGIAGANAVVGAGKKFAIGAAKKLSGFNYLKKNYDMYSKKRKERADEIDKKRWGGWVGNKLNKGQDTLYAKSKIPVLSSRAKKRLDKMKTDENKKAIDEGAKDLIDKGANTDTLAQQMNTHFSAPPPTTTQGKIDQAKSATAYLRQDADERKMHIQNTLSASGGVAGSDLEHIMNMPTPVGLSPSAAASYTAAKAHAQLAAHDIALGLNPANRENDLRAVAAFVNSQMKRKVDTGANA